MPGVGSGEAPLPTAGGHEATLQLMLLADSPADFPTLSQGKDVGRMQFSLQVWLLGAVGEGEAEAWKAAVVTLA